MDLSETAAELPVFHTVVEEVRPVLLYHQFDLTPVGKQYLDLEPVFPGGFLDEIVGFLEEPSGVEGKDRDLRGGAGDHVGDDLIFEAQAGSEGDLPSRKGVRRPAQDLFGGFARKGVRIFVDSDFMITSHTTC